MNPYYQYPYQNNGHNMIPYPSAYLQPLSPYMQYPIASPNITMLKPILSNHPAKIRLTAFKELTGYPNYGNPSGNADILYTGNKGNWTILIPPQLFFTGSYKAQLVIRAVLDDHSNVPVRQYSATISINGDYIHKGRLQLEHGKPAGKKFTNWRELTFNVQNLKRNNRVQIVNTSRTGENDWIGLDWMEIRLIPR